MSFAVAACREYAPPPEVPGLTRAAVGGGPDAAWLLRVKAAYDPDSVFSAITVPAELSGDHDARAAVGGC